MAVGPFEQFTHLSGWREFERYLDDLERRIIDDLRDTIPRWKDGRAEHHVASADGALRTIDRIRDWKSHRVKVEKEHFRA